MTIIINIIKLLLIEIVNIRMKIITMIILITIMIITNNNTGMRPTGAGSLTSYNRGRKGSAERTCQRAVRRSVHAVIY